MQMGLQIGHEEKDGWQICFLEGRLDTSSSALLEKKLSGLLEANKTHILLDFAKIDYLSSAGIRVLLSVTKKLSINDGVLALCSLQEDVLKIIKLAGFERILNIYPTQQAAFEAHK